MSNQKQVNEKRKAILAAAERVFASSGYASATVEAVAEDAGVAKGSIYNYFESKEDLFVQVFLEAMAIQSAQADRLVEEDLSATEKLNQLLDDWYVRLGEYQRISRLILEVWAVTARHERKGKLEHILRRMYAEWSGRLAAIISQGIRRGEFDAQADAGSAARLIMATGDGATMYSVLDTGMVIDEKFLGAFKRAIASSLAPRDRDRDVGAHR